MVLPSEGALPVVRTTQWTGDDESVTREATVTHLVEQGIEFADARSYIEQLLLNGYLDEVNDELRIPSPPGREETSPVSTVALLEGGLGRARASWVLGRRLFDGVLSDDLRLRKERALTS